jgi:ribosomal 50S subunit-recycling heat shock protein
MRIDLFLKKTLIIKQRDTAKELCDKGMVKVNGLLSKPSREIREGDLIEIDGSQGTLRYRVLKIPDGNVRKEEANEFYEGSSS